MCLDERVSIDVERAWSSYQQRFHRRFGEDKAPGAYVRFRKHMIQRLDRQGFEPRLANYLEWHQECKEALESGATINEALILEFEEAAAWLAIEPPRVLDMFQGELGDPFQA